MWGQKGADQILSGKVSVLCFLFFFVRCSKLNVVYIMLDGGVGSWFEDIKRLLLWITLLFQGD